MGSHADATPVFVILHYHYISFTWIFLMYVPINSIYVDIPNIIYENSTKVYFIKIYIMLRYLFQ